MNKPTNKPMRDGGAVKHANLLSNGPWDDGVLLVIALLTAEFCGKGMLRDWTGIEMWKNEYWCHSEKSEYRDVSAVNPTQQARRRTDPHLASEWS